MWPSKTLPRRQYNLEDGFKRSYGLCSYMRMLNINGKTFLSLRVLFSLIVSYHFQVIFHCIQSKGIFIRI